MLATGLVLRHADRERDRREATVVALTEGALRATVAGPLDRLRDVSAAVRGPEGLRRREFDTLAERVLRQPGVASVALIRSLPGSATGPSAAPEDRAPLGRFSVVFSALKDGRASLTEVGSRQVGAVLQGAVRSGNTQATLPLVRRNGGSPLVVAVVPVRRSEAGGPSGALTVSFPADRVRSAVADRLPANVRFELAEGARPPRRFTDAVIRQVPVGDGAWTVAVERPRPGLGLAIATFLGGGLLTGPDRDSRQPVGAPRAPRARARRRPSR